MGRNPRATARQIAGAYNRATGQREGGLIGLSSQQMKWVNSAGSELRDPREMANYLDRKLRDRRYDRTVERARREGRGLTQAEADKITRRYADRLLAFRAETIARTETQRAAHLGNQAGFRQLIEDGHVRRDQVRKVWKATNDRRTRDSHFALHGESVAFDEAFTSPITGAQIKHPGDPDAPASETANCRCWLSTRIDYLSNLR